jgi:hypothetical protein
MKRLALFSVIAACSLGLVPGGSVSAQSEVLAEMYGRAVHAYNGGLYDEASKYLSLAIDNGIQDPRAYYFRGMAAFAKGDTQGAEADWQMGADLEAAGKTNPAVGRSLSRFQGSGRIHLEEIRQKARLNAMAVAAERSKQRYGELGAPVPGEIVGSSPAATPRAPIAPPPIPSDTENPFSDDVAAGQPNVAAPDALEGAMNDPFAQEAAPAAAGAPAGSDPFGGDAPAADPFGGDAGGADPFGGDAGAGEPPAEPAAGDDPFGSDAGAADPAPPSEDPFGDAGGADPFAG